VRQEIARYVTRVGKFHSFCSVFPVLLDFIDMAISPDGSTLGALSVCSSQNLDGDETGKGMRDGFNDHGRLTKICWGYEDAKMRKYEVEDCFLSQKFGTT
jgi:hypothetical protein